MYIKLGLYIYIYISFYHFSAYSENNNTIATCSQGPSLPTNMEDSKPNFSDEARKQVKAEREAKKAAKAAAKAKGKNKKIDNVKNEPPIVSDKILEKTAETENLDIKNVQSVDLLSSNLVKVKTAKSSNAKNDVIEEKSKAELRAERRAKQEVQRAVKQQLLLKNSKENKNTSEHPIKTSVKKDHKDEDIHGINLFKHLSQGRNLALFNRFTVNSNIHPKIIRLGVQYADKVIVGSNARCLALLIAIKDVILCFKKPENVDFIRGLDANLQESVAYLNHCRPLAVSMQNALHHIKWQMTQSSSLSSDESDEIVSIVITAVYTCVHSLPNNTFDLF